MLLALAVIWAVVATIAAWVRHRAADRHSVDLFNARQRIAADHAELTKLRIVQDLDMPQLGQQIAERDERIEQLGLQLAQAEIHKLNLSLQLTAATGAFPRTYLNALIRSSQAKPGVDLVKREEA